MAQLNSDQGNRQKSFDRMNTMKDRMKSARSSYYLLFILSKLFCLLP